MSGRVLEVDALHLGTPVQNLSTGQRHTITVRREVVPIIFVPGIMGSRLVDDAGREGEREKVWDPDDKGFMVGRYGFRGSNPLRKKIALLGEDVGRRSLRAYDDDRAHNGKHLASYGAAGRKGEDPERHANLRGWGGVAWDLYGEFLVQLHEGNPGSHAAISSLFGSGEWPAFDLPVYAFGYDWTASNLESGQALATFIQSTINGYRTRGRTCERVILVTHSMGGLVARSACMLHGAHRQVLGVIHGVQPATGSAAAYWRMQGGFPRPPAWDVFGVIGARVLGVDGREVTALLGNMAGGLELLPNQHYTSDGRNHGWLCWPLEGGGERRLPTGGDPYDEIYLERDEPWRLIRDPAWLVPEVAGPAGRPPATRAPVDNAWRSFVARMTAVQKLHTDLGTKQHPRTYHFYGTGEHTPASITFDDEDPHRPEVPYILRTRIVSEGRSMRGAADLLTEQADNTGEYTLYLPLVRTADRRWLPTLHMRRLQMRQAAEDGDATVPKASGSALCSQPGTQASEAHRGYTHEKAYTHGIVHQFAMRAIGSLLELRASARTGHPVQTA